MALEGGDVTDRVFLRCVWPYGEGEWLRLERRRTETAGLRTQARIAVEGIIARHEDHVSALTGAARDARVSLNERPERDLALIGAADHLLYLGNKPVL
ncbi:MAG: hypothetical protein ACUVS4_15620 [Chloroflexaceae bacterium]